MATVTGITAAKAQEILDGTVVTGTINGSGHLILTKGDGSVVDAGLVVPELPITGTKAEYDTALSDANFATLALAETLLNKTLTAPAISDPVISGVGEERFFYKAADESVTSSTALQNDNDITFSVEANAKYHVEGRLFLDYNTSYAIKMTWSMPALAKASGLFGDGNANMIYDISSEGFVPNYGASAPNNMPVEAIIVVGSNAGTVTLRWAQETSGGIATTIRKHSFIRVRRVA